MLGSKNRIRLQSFKIFVSRGAMSKVQKLLQKSHPADLGMILPYLRPSEAQTILTQIAHRGKQAQVLASARPDSAAELLRQLDIPLSAAILQEMSPDDSAQLLELLDEDLRTKLFEQMAELESEQLQDHLVYKTETAGRLMVTDFLALSPKETVADAIEALRKAPSLEVVYYLYLVSGSGKLQGVVSLRQLLLVAPETELREIMSPNVISARIDEDQEVVAARVDRYDLLALPVVDHVGRMVGVVTVDDVIDVIKDEATEDMLRMAGASADDPLLTGSTLTSVRLRSPWLLASSFAGMFNFFVMHQFEDLLSRAVLLAGFVPIVLGMGGNVGSQSATLLVRGLALRIVDGSQYFRLMLRQLKVGLTLGVGYGIIVAGLVLGANLVGGFGSEGATVFQLAGTAGLGIFCSMMVATTIGTTVPLVLDWLGIDPAIATGPIVTTSTDMFGCLAYFGIATLLIGG